MVEELPSSRELSQSDRSHLNVLSVLHFVGAGLAGLGILFIVFHFVAFRALLNNPATAMTHGQGPSPAAFFSMFKWFYLVMGAWYGTSLVMNLFAGSYLRAR